MFLRYYKCKTIQTIKILKCYSIDEKATSVPKDDAYLLELELKMKDGSAHYVKIEPRVAFKKYDDFFHNHKDENYHHNQNMIRRNNLLDIYDEDVIPMPENPESDSSKCVIS